MKRRTKNRRASALKKRLWSRTRPRRLKRAILRNMAARKRSRRSGNARPGLLRKLFLLILVGTAGWYGIQRGYADKLNLKALTPASLKKAVAPEPEKAKPKPEPEPKAAQAVSEKKESKGSWLKRFIKRQIPAQPPMALVRLNALYGIGRDRVLVALDSGAAPDLPVVSGIARDNAAPGDTVPEAATALDIIAAGQKHRGLMRRISEILVTGRDRVEVLFADVKLRARLGSKDPAVQVENLAALLAQPNAPHKGVINMVYGNIAFLKEEK
jgi:hypothetical protein